MRYSELNELKRWQSPDAVDDYKLIAFRGNYWMLPLDGDIPIQVVQDIMTHTGITANGDVDPYDFIENITDFFEHRPDVINATVMNNELHIDRHSMATHHPVVSQMIKKLVNDLGLQGTNVAQFGSDDDIYNYHNKFQSTGDLPDTLFHGTHSGHLIQIAKTGLRAGQAESNWKDAGISHPNLIFGSVEINDTVFHANKTSGMGDTGETYYESDPDTEFPVIIEFKLPDKNLIVPDYDVAALFLGRTEQTDSLGYGNSGSYYSQHSSEISDNNPEERAWKSTGIYGYKGRIPPSHIIKVYTNFFDGPLTDEPSWYGTLPEFFEMLEEQREEYFGIEDEDEWE